MGSLRSPVSLALAGPGLRPDGVHDPRRPLRSGAEAPGNPLTALESGEVGG